MNKYKQTLSEDVIIGLVPDGRETMANVKESVPLKKIPGIIIAIKKLLLKLTNILTNE